jgi:hypothetical protein
MTTFQDPPPQSRRSARQNERGDEAAAFGHFPPQAPVQPGQPGQYPTQQAAPATGRRARAAEAPGQYDAPAEPLNYSTQGRQPAAPSPLNDVSQTPGYAPSPAEPAPYRVRDFSPEGAGRRAAAPPLVEPSAPIGNAPGASDLEYRTQGLPGAYVQPGPSADPAGHQTLSRRELRQRQAEQEAAAALQTGGQYLTQPQAPPMAPPAAPAQYPVQPPAQQAPVAPAQYPGQPAPAQYPGQPPQYPAQQTAPPPARPPGQPTALSNARAEFEALSRTGQGLPQAAPAPTYPQPGMPPSVEQTGGRVVPTGHWSRQADLDDETQPWENTITREVGGGNVATTTSALVLPQIPRADPFATALNSTGEVLLTGSIDLPRSLGSKGGDSRHYDDPMVDHMFDTQDAEFTGTDSSPVRAIRAVSTHTSARGVIHANKPHGNRLIVVVFVATAILAVGVVGMLVASLAFNLF